MVKSSLRLKVITFLVPVLEPEGKTRVLMVRGRAFAEALVAKYEACISWAPISVILMGFVLKRLERLAPRRAAPRTAASSALTFTATLSLRLLLVRIDRILKPILTPQQLPSQLFESSALECFRQQE